MSVMRLAFAFTVLGTLDVTAATPTVDVAVQGYQERGGRVVRARRCPASRSRSSTFIASRSTIATSNRSLR